MQRAEAGVDPDDIAECRLHLARDDDGQVISVN